MKLLSKNKYCLNCLRERPRAILTVNHIKSKNNIYIQFFVKFDVGSTRTMIFKNDFFGFLND